MIKTKTELIRKRITTARNAIDDAWSEIHDDENISFRGMAMVLSSLSASLKNVLHENRRLEEDLSSEMMESQNKLRREHEGES